MNAHNASTTSSRLVTEGDDVDLAPNLAAVSGLATLVLDKSCTVTKSNTCCTMQTKSLGDVRAGGVQEALQHAYM